MDTEIVAVLSLGCIGLIASVMLAYVGYHHDRLADKCNRLNETIDDMHAEIIWKQDVIDRLKDELN